MGQVSKRERDYEGDMLRAVTDAYPGNSSARAGYIAAASAVLRIAAQCRDPDDAWNALNEIRNALASCKYVAPPTDDGAAAKGGEKT